MKATKNWSKASGRKTVLMAGMVAMALSFVLVLTGCPKETDSTENTEPKSITITGITGITGGVSVNVLSSPSETGEVARGTGIASDTLTVALQSLTDGSPWTGSGDYFVMIRPSVGSTEYVYTDGKTFGELGITSQADMGKLPKLGINSASTSVAFDKFKPMGSK